MRPILQRELIRGARDPAFLMVRWLAGLSGVMLLVCVVWVVEDTPAQVGLTVFRWFHYLWGAALLGIGVWLTVPALVTELEDGTLGLLYLTSLRPFEVVGGKAAGSAIRAGVLWLTAIPVSTVPLVLGAVSIADVLRSLAMDFALLSCGLSVGLLFSAVAKDSVSARRGAWGIGLSTGVLVVGGLGVIEALLAGLPRLVLDLAGMLYGLAAGSVVGLVGLVVAGSLLSKRWRELDAPPPATEAEEEPDWIEIEEAASRIAWRDGPGRRLRSRWPLGWLRLRNGGQVETFWIWPLLVVALWAVASVSRSVTLALVAGWGIGVGLCLQGASAYRSELRAGALELLMTTPVPTFSYILNRVLLGIREFGLALLAHGLMSEIALRYSVLSEPLSGLAPDRRPTLFPEMLFWPFLATLTGPAVGLVVTARVANLPAAACTSAACGVVLPTLAIVLHHWMGAPRWLTACVLSAFVVQTGCLIHLVLRDLHQREFAVMQLRPK